MHIIKTWLVLAAVTMGILHFNTIRADSSTSAWTNVSNMSILGYNLKKVSGCDGCADAGPVSAAAINSGDGSVEFTAPDTLGIRAMGLSNGNTDNYISDIDFAFQLYGYGGSYNLEVRENGAYKSNSSYSPGDVLKISLESGKIKYYKNGTLFYTSLKAPTYPLFVDSAFLNLNSALNNVIVKIADTLPPSVPAGLSATAISISQINLSWSASSDNVGVVEYKIFRNGAQIGTSNSTSHSDANLSPSTQYYYSISANDAAGNNSAQSASASATTQSVAAAATSDPNWSNLNNMTISGGNLKKSSGCDGCSDAGPISTASIKSGDGWVEFTAGDASTIRALGLSNGNTDNSISDIDYAFQLYGFSGSGNLEVRENGSYKTNSSYLAGDNFKISVESGKIKYYKNGSLIYTSQRVPVYPLLVDTSFLNLNGSLNNISIKSFETHVLSSFSASPLTVKSGDSVNLSWANISNPALQDWAGLYLKSETDDKKYLEWLYLSSCAKNIQNVTSAKSSGTCSFALPSSLSSGTYEFRFFANNAFTRLGVSNSVEFVLPAIVSASTISPSFTGISDVPDPTKLPKATIDQSVLNTAYNASNVPALSAGRYYLDPTTKVKIYKLTSDIFPTTFTGWKHDYSEGGDEISLPYKSDGTRAVLVRQNGSPYYWYLLDFTPGVGVSNPRLLSGPIKPWIDLAFTFSNNPATPYYAYVSNGVSIVRFDIRTMQSASGNGWPLNESSAMWLHQSKEDGLFTWMRGANGPTAVGYKPSTGILKTQSHVDLNEPRIDRDGRYIGFSLGSPNQNKAVIWDWESNNIAWSGGGIPFPFAHQASLRGRWIGVDWTLSFPAQYWVMNPSTPNSFKYIGGPANGTLVHGNGNWIQNPANLDDQWAVFTNYGTLQSGYSWLSPNGIVFVNLNGDRRLLGHSYNTSSDYGSYSFVKTSSDGKYVMFTSNMNGSGRTDVFLAEMPTLESYQQIPVPDTTPPSIPTGLLVTAISSSQINLSWTASTDVVGVTGYKIFHSGVQIGTSATSSFSSTGLSPSTSYTYVVSAFDAAGNVSAQSASASAITQTPVVATQNKFLPGNRVKTTTYLVVRSSPNGYRIGYQRTGNLGTVLEGPIFAGRYKWWKINYDNWPDGWSAENWLVKY